EITEGVLIENVARAASMLNALKILGVRIALDDFGTGYSSLSYLQSLPLDRIKIDQSFIASLGRTDRSLAVVRAVIGLAHGLELPHDRPSRSLGPVLERARRAHGSRKERHRRNPPATRAAHHRHGVAVRCRRCLRAVAAPKR